MGHRVVVVGGIAGVFKPWDALEYHLWRHNRWGARARTRQEFSFPGGATIARGCGLNRY